MRYKYIKAIFFSGKDFIFQKLHVYSMYFCCERFLQRKMLRTPHNFYISFSGGPILFYNLRICVSLWVIVSFLWVSFASVNSVHSLKCITNIDF